MANQHNGEVELSVGGKTFNLKLNHNKVAEAEPHMQHSIFQVERGGIAEMRALLFVMTKGANGINTIDEAGTLLDEDPSACMEAVNEAVNLFFQRYGKPQKEKEAASS